MPWPIRHYPTSLAGLHHECRPRTVLSPSVDQDGICKGGVARTLTIVRPALRSTALRPCGAGGPGQSAARETTTPRFRGAICRGTCALELERVSCSGVTLRGPQLPLGRTDHPSSRLSSCRRGRRPRVGAPMRMARATPRHARASRSDCSGTLSCRAASAQCPCAVQRALPDVVLHRTRPLPRQHSRNPYADRARAMPCKVTGQAP